MLNKKAQVTVFIIIGIVILAVFSAILYITNITVTESFQVEAQPVRETVPQEFVALQEYTEACLASVAEQGLLLLGQQGGYIYPATIGEFSLANPTDSDGLILDPILVPYWYYNPEENGGDGISISSLRPPLHIEEEGLSIEHQLGTFIEENVESCLQNYAVFEKQNYFVSYDEKEAHARARNGFVDFTLKMPLEAQRGGATTEMETFFIVLDVDLEHLYGVASKISELQQDTNFLEYHTLNVLSTHTGLAQDKFPPKLQIEYDQVVSQTWATPLVEENLKSLLLNYIPTIRFAGSDNFVRYEYPNSELSGVYQQVYDDMILGFPDDGESPNVNGLLINFDYFNWDPYLDLNAGEQQTTATSLFIDSPLDLISYDISFQKYLNTYDISYPLLARVEDPNALNGLGFSLNFAMEPNIINNKPVTTDTLIPAKIITGQDSLLCDPKQKDTEFINSLVIDAANHDPLESVSFAYSVPFEDRCGLGLSEDDGEFGASYPLAYGGILDLKLDGYLPQYFIFDTYDFKREAGVVGYAVAGIDRPVLEMYPLKEIEVRVKKKNLEKCVRPVDVDACLAGSGQENFDECMSESSERVCFFNSGSGLFLPNEAITSTEVSGSRSHINEWYFINNEKNLDDNEEVSLIFERMHDVGGPYDGVYEGAHTTVANVKSDENAIIELAPGEYKVTVINQVILDEPYIIPQDWRCTTSKRKDCFIVEQAVLDNLVTATYVLDSEETYFIVTREDLYASNLLEFHILNQGLSSLPETFTTSFSVEDEMPDIAARLAEDMIILGEFQDLVSQVGARSNLKGEWLVE